LTREVDAFAEAEALADRFGPRPPGSAAERQAADHLEARLEALGREVDVEPFAVWPAWPLGYAINAIVAVLGGVLAISSPTAGTLVVLAAVVLTFPDLAGISPTTRRLLGRSSSQNVVSWGDRDLPGALVLVAHYDSGPTRAWPLRPLFWALLALLACCVLRAGGLEGTLLAVAQFVPTVALIVYVALLLDIALSPAAPGENDNASGVAVVLRLAERLGQGLEHFGVHLLFTGSQKAMAQGMRAFLKAHRAELASGDSAVVNVDRVGSGEINLTRKEGPLLTTRSHPQLTGMVDANSCVAREPSDGYAAASAGLAAVTVTATGERLEEVALAEVEELCAELADGIDAELSRP
jgi:uncharacterized membrane protein YhaH (DUF805 family)